MSTHDDDDAAPQSPLDPVDATLVQDEVGQARSQERSSAATPPDVPGHKLVRRLGGGAFGEVWLAVQENTGRHVAVKFFSRHKGLDWPLLKREVGKLLQALTERRIVHLLQVGWESDPPYYIMEYLPGGTLADRIAKGDLTSLESVQMFREVARALLFLHGKAILHCDLKPSNVLLDDHGQVRLADFGQAQLSSEAGPAAGTLFYMAPELAQPGARPDVRSDIYSLGAVLYTMLAGHAPHATESSSRDLASSESTTDRIELYRQLVEQAPPLDMREIPGIDKALAGIVEHCLAPNPAQRFENVHEVLDAIQTRERRRSQRPLVVLGLAGPLALLATMTLIGGWALGQAETSAREALTQNQLESLLGTARVTSAALDRNLEAVVRRVQREGERQDLVRDIKASSGVPSPPLQATMEELYDSYKDRHFYSWVIANRDGVALARAPFDERVVGNRYDYREWFTGHPQTPDHAPGPPRTESGLTLAFESSARGNPLLVSVATPVRDDEEHVVGIVAATLRLSTFNEWLEDAEGRTRDTDCPSRFIALINRTQLVRHPCPREGAPALPVGEADFLDAATIQELLTNSAGVSAHYADPMRTGESYLAAAAALENNPGWFAILQENRQQAMRPISDLTTHFRRLGYSAFGLGVLAVGAVWGALLRMTRRPRAALS